MSEAVAVPQAVAPLPAATPAAPVRRFVIPDDPEVMAPSGATPAPAKAEQDKATSETPAPEGETPTPEVKEELTPEKAAEAERKKEGNRFQKRLDKVYRQRAEAEAKANFLAQELEKVKQVQAPKTEGEPTLAQFDYDPEKYAQAKADFEKKRVLQEVETKQRTAQQQAATQTLLTAWEEKSGKGSEKYDDWDEVVGELTPNSVFTAAIMDAENSEEVAYYLGKNTKEAQRIAKLPPLSQAREIGKLEGTLLAKSVAPKTPSKAPAPITPVTGTTPTVNTEPSEADDMKSWMQKRQRQVHGRR